MPTYVSKKATQLDNIFERAGYTKAGGMWGDAQWKKLGSQMVVAIGGAYGRDDWNGDFTQAPVSPVWPACVHVYNGEACINYDVTEGEAPCDGTMQDGLAVHSQVFANVADAMAAVALLEKVLNEPA